MQPNSNSKLNTTSNSKSNTKSNRKAYQNINKDTDATLNKNFKKLSTKLFTSTFNDSVTPPTKPAIKNPVVIAIDGPGVYIGSVRIPYVRPPICLPPFYESQREHLKSLIKRIDSAGLHKSSKIIPKSLKLTFDQDVVVDRAPVDSFLEAMNKRMRDAKLVAAVAEKKPELTLFEMLQADTLKAITVPKLPPAIVTEEREEIIKYESKEQTLANQLAMGSILRNEHGLKAEVLISTRPTVAYKDIQQSIPTEPLQTLSALTLQHLKKLGKGNFAALGIDNLVSTHQPTAALFNTDFQDASGLLHFNRIQINPLDDVEDIIGKIDAKQYAYGAFDFLNRPLLRVDETFHPQQDSKQVFLEPQEMAIKHIEKSVVPPHFLPVFLSLLSFECRTQHSHLYRYIPFIESLTSLPLPESQDARRLLDLISSLLPLPLSPELTLEYIQLYDSLAGLSKLSARLRIHFRERVLSILETHQGPIRIKLAQIYIDCAGDKEYAVSVMLKEGSQDVRRVVDGDTELLCFAIGVLLGDLKSSAPFERIRALSAIDSLVSDLDLVEILNETVDRDSNVIVNSALRTAVKALIEEVLVTAWEDWSINVKELCIKIISDLGLQKEIYKGIVLQLSSQNCTKQIAAIRRVGEFKIVEGMGKLVPCLSDAHVMIRIEAFKAVAMFEGISDRDVLSGILVGCTDCEAEVRIVSLQALACTKGTNAQVRESLYYLLHYDPIEHVKEEVITTIQKLSLILHFQSSLILIYTSLKKSKFQELIYAGLSGAGVFVLKHDEKNGVIGNEKVHSEILLGPGLYELMSGKEKEVVERGELVSEREEEALLQRVNRLCTKEAIIRQATNQEYIPLVVPPLS